MDYKEALGNIRTRIDGLDDQIIDLFAQRLALALQAGELKVNNNLSLTDQERERQVVQRLCQRVDDKLSGETALLTRSIIALSREYQRKAFFKSPEPLLAPPQELPKGQLRCVYQGLPGAFSEEALVKLFPQADKRAVDSFEDVFAAVKRQEAHYGVVPIENSRTGAIGETYDLLRKYGCFVVGKTYIPIRHCLMASQDMELENVRELLSHPEGFGQCRNFLCGRAWDLTACRNTAMAAEAVAQSSDGRKAAIGSRRAAELNNLKILAEDIMDDPGNQTAFIVLASQPQYDEKSDIVSLTFATAHRSGALCEALLPFMAMGINLLRIESRPAAMGNYRFFVDIAGHIDERSVQLSIQQATSVCDYLEVLGCYRLS